MDECCDVECYHRDARPQRAACSYLLIKRATVLRGGLPRAQHHHPDEMTLRGYNCDELLQAGILRGYGASNLASFLAGRSYYPQCCTQFYGRDELALFDN